MVLEGHHTVLEGQFFGNVVQFEKNDYSDAFTVGKYKLKLAIDIY